MPSQSMEKQEFKLQDQMNNLAKINLGKIARKFNKELNESDIRKNVIINSNYDLKVFLG